MSLFSKMFGGGTTQGHLTTQNAIVEDKIKRGYADAGDNIRGGYEQGYEYLEPYAQRGNDAYDLYSDSIGVGGEEGYGRAFETFEADPFREYAGQDNYNALRRIDRAYNSGGMRDSGASRLALARASGEFARRDVDDFRDRLAGMGSTGANIAQTQAGMATNQGAQLADLDIGKAGSLANTRMNLYNAQNKMRDDKVNRNMAIAGQVAGLALNALAPGLGGSIGGSIAGGLGASTSGNLRNALMGQGFK